MSNLVTITSKFYDRSGRRVINLNVMSRYQGSKRENLQKTDIHGQFVFQASPYRTIEILVKPPNQKDYTVFKIISSSIDSSSQNPICIQLPKTIEEYKQKELVKTKARIVTTTFKVVDCLGRVVSNFPVQSRPKGKKNVYERYTDENGIVEVLSSPDRDIEILVLTSDDQFVLNSSVNSGNGSQQPILIQLDEPYSNFISNSIISLLDRDGSHYITAETQVEMLIIDTGVKKYYNISNGKLPVRSMIGQKLQFAVLKPDGTPLDPIYYFAKRIKETSLKLHLDVDVVDGQTQKQEPTIDKNLKVGECTCNRDIEEEEFKKITTSSTAISFLRDLNQQFKKFGMNCCLEKAHFIAHTLHETARYSLMEEGLGGKSESEVYDGYKGRGLMQLTYKKNYELYGLAVNENFLGNHRHRIAKEKRHAVGSAIWYWHHSRAGSLTPHANNNDLITTCALINGGYNGFDDREKYYKKSVAAFNIEKCKNLNKGVIAALDEYTKFENSYIYNNKVGECFGWGLWNDPNGYKKGKLKNANEAKKGYIRFLEISKNKEFPFGYREDKNGNKISRKRYGFSAKSAKSLAEKRIKEL